MAFGVLAIFRLTDKPTAIGCRIIYDTTSPKQAERSKKMNVALDKERFGPWALVTGLASALQPRRTPMRLRAVFCSAAAAVFMFAVNCSCLAASPDAAEAKALID